MDLEEKVSHARHFQGLIVDQIICQLQCCCEVVLAMVVFHREDP